MNVTVQRDFAKAVATVRHATDAKSLPILSTSSSRPATSRFASPGRTSAHRFASRCRPR